MSLATASCPRSVPRRSPTSRTPRAGRRSLPTGSTCSPSTPGRERSPGSRSPQRDLTLLGSTPVNDNGGVGGTDDAVCPDGQNLYINETAAHGVAEMTINGGTLTELPGLSGRASREHHRFRRSGVQLTPRLQNKAPRSQGNRPALCYGGRSAVAAMRPAADRRSGCVRGQSSHFLVQNVRSTRSDRARRNDRKRRTQWSTSRFSGRAAKGRATLGCREEATARV